MFIEQNPIDHHLAKRLKLIRNSCGMTQDELGELIGVTFQQIQKYETALNKISASRLYEICRVLDKPISSFFSGISIDKEYYNFKFVSERKVLRENRKREKEITNLIGLFNQIENPEVRFSVIKLLSNIVKSQGKNNTY